MKESGRVLVVVVLIATIAAILFAAIGGRLQSHTGGIADVDTIGYDRCGFGGLDAKGYGSWTDPASDSRKRGEVYTTSRLWYAWWEDGTSRPVTTAAFIVACGPLGVSAPHWVLYRFSYRESAGGSWVGFTQDTVPQGVNRAFVTIQGTGVGLLVVHMPAFELLIDGFTFKPCTFPDAKTDTAQMGCTPGATTQSIKDGAALRVEVYIENTALFGGYDPILIAQDEVELRSAIPTRFEWASGGYDVGETAILNYEVPVTEYELCTTPTTCEYKPAYFITITDLNTNTPIPGWDRTEVPATQGSVQVAVTGAYFSNDLAVCQNRLRAQIYTDIILINQDDTAIRANSTVLTVGPAPSMDEITFDREEYQEGDTVTISWTASGNITRFHVTAQTAGLVALDEDYPPTTFSTNFRAAATGILEVEVTPYYLCQPGDVKEVQATIGNVLPELCELFPDTAECSTSDVWGIVLVVIAIILIIIGTLIFNHFFASFKFDGMIILIGTLLVMAVLSAVFIALGFFDYALGV